MRQAHTKQITRREFLDCGTRLIGGLVAAPTIITSAALGREGRAPASERIVMGTIGLGGRGKTVMQAFMRQPEVQMVAVCDVKGEARDEGTAIVDKYYDSTDCTAHIDLRELIARPNIDAVLIATGDNWHSLASCLAARAGKDIYCEKPLSVAISESRQVAETIRRHRRVFQCGMQRRSLDHFRFAVDLARRGFLGELRTLHAERADLPPLYDTRLPAEEQPPLEVFAWDLWLGPAPWRPYNHKCFTRGFWSSHVDFSGGSINEWGSHTVDLCQWANDADATSAVEYEPAGEDAVAHYADGVKLVIRRGIGKGSCGVRFEGTKGFVQVDDSGHIEVYPESLRSTGLGKGYPVDDHVRNFLDCVKSRQQPIANADVAHHSITTCHLANISNRLRRAVKWDPVREVCIGDERANRLRSRAYRQPWRL